MPFTASIIQRNFIYVPDTILKLGAAAWLRKLPVLSEPWSRIRIGLICAVTPNGTGNIADVMFTLGICSGNVYPGSNVNTLNFLGASLIGTQAVGATRLLTYTASATGPYYACTAGYFFAKAEGNVYSTGAGFSPALALSTAFTGRYDRRTLIVLDITKSQGDAGAVTMTLYGPSTTLVQNTDYRPDDLQYALDNVTTPTIRGQALSVLSSNSTVVFSPLTGDIDTLEVFWSSNAFPLEISAIGATIILPPFYSSNIAGSAIDTFEGYATSSGSIPESTFLTGGSGWSGAGSIGYDVVDFGASANTSNLAPQVYGQLIGTTNVPDDPFEQYLAGTVNSGVTVNQGTFWGGPAIIVAQANLPAPQSFGAYVGTTSQPIDTFEQYSLGTVNSGITINQGTFWGGNATITGASLVYGPCGFQANFVGTQGAPWEPFEAYTVNNGSTTGGTTSIFAYGSFWTSYGSIYSGGSYNQTRFGTTAINPLPAINIIYGTTAGNAFYGTVIGQPHDTFEQYSVGVIVSGATVNAGSGWSTYGTVYSYSI